MAGTIPTATATVEGAASLPWRGPGSGKPDLPVPPARLPLLQRGQLRKQWRYVGYYGENVMLCAAVVTIGVFTHSFWSLWDRGAPGGGRSFEHTRLRPGRPEVILDGPRVEIRTAEVKASLVLGETEPVEVISESGRAWGWTRKRAGVPVSGRIEVAGRTIEAEGFGVDDESAGFHARHTAWSWSAGIGTDVEGRALGWNLVEGINDSPIGSERAVWVDGVPYEPGPVRFQGLDSVTFEPGPASGDGEQPDALEFEFGGAERHRRDNYGLIHSHYVHRFGTFRGSLDGIQLASAAGVMEEHDVHW